MKCEKCKVDLLKKNISLVETWNKLIKNNLVYVIINKKIKNHKEQNLRYSSYVLSEYDYLECPNCKSFKFVKIGNEKEYLREVK